MEQSVTKENYSIGMEVVRGKDWKWGDQDGFPGNIGTIIEDGIHSSGNNWVRVEWKGGGNETYQIGPKTFDLLTHNKEEIHELW